MKHLTTLNISKLSCEHFGPFMCIYIYFFFFDILVLSSAVTLASQIFFKPDSLILANIKLVFEANRTKYKQDYLVIF